jgi:hypothetical protein
LLSSFAANELLLLLEPSSAYGLATQPAADTASLQVAENSFDSHFAELGAHPFANDDVALITL